MSPIVSILEGCHRCHVQVIADGLLVQLAMTPPHRGIMQALHMLLKAHKGLVLSAVRRSMIQGGAPEDLFMEGLQGLSMAIDNFDPAMGCKLSTYAHWFIRDAMTKCLWREGCPLRWAFSACRHTVKPDHPDHVTERPAKPQPACTA